MEGSENLRVLRKLGGSESMRGGQFRGKGADSFDSRRCQDSLISLRIVRRFKKQFLSGAQGVFGVARRRKELYPQR